MAVQRRSYDDANEADVMGFNPQGIEDAIAGAGSFNPNDPFGNGQDRPNAFYALSPEEQKAIEDLQSGAIAGNRESAAQTFDAQQPRTPVAASAPAEADPMADILAMLPQGVEAQPSAEATGMGAGSVPGLPRAPVTSVARNQPPAMAQGGGMGTSPKRNTFESPSALFAGGKAGSALGRPGGFSLPGQSQGGPQATKQMLELLKQLQGVGV